MPDDMVLPDLPIPEDFPEEDEVLDEAAVPPIDPMPAMPPPAGEVALPFVPCDGAGTV